MKRSSADGLVFHQLIINITKTSRITYPKTFKYYLKWIFSIVFLFGGFSRTVNAPPESPPP